MLEIGGTHVTAALVDLESRAVRASVRRDLDPHSARDSIVGTFAAAARDLDVPAPRRWGVAIPGPFDYATGIGDFRGIGKFDALRDLDVGRALVQAAPERVSECAFINDGEAFARGEWMLGGRDSGRWTVLTLGTGVGSSYLVDGVPVRSGPGVPLNGHVHNLVFDGRPIETRVSRAALIDAYREATGDETDVRDIAERARAGDPAAASVFTETFDGLGHGLAGSLREFGTDMLVIGGSIARSWDLVAPPLRRAIQHEGGAGGLEIVRARDLDHSGLFGAALVGRR
ncbi:ROK family protein [Microbacterium sp. RD1]|uniref:ROK family protein n=1 Tax=Microbacterium sp. RD1 TaxID=3457313 RepID=UPI003FA5A7D7